MFFKKQRLNKTYILMCHFKSYFCLSLFASVSVALAQPLLPPQVQQNADRINQNQFEQFQRAEQMQRARADAQRQKSPSEKAATEAETKADPNAFRLPIDEIIIENAPHLPESEKAKIQQDFAGKELTTDELQNIIRRLTNWYIKQGWIAARAFFPPQDILTRRLRVTVIEGFVENIRQEGKPSVDVRTAFPNVKGNMLYLRDVEQGLEQINRLQSRKATVDLQPGMSFGGTDLVVKSTGQKSLPLSLSFDNNGLESTGKYAMRANTYLENFAHLNEQLMLSYSVDPTLRQDGNFNQSIFSQLSIPYGYWTFSGSYYWSNYLNEVNNDGLKYALTGVSEGVNLGVSWLSYRDEQWKVEHGLKFQFSSSETELDKTLLQTNSRDLAFIEVSSNASYQSQGSITKGSLSLIQGIDVFGVASDKDRVSSKEPIAQATFFQASLEMQKILPEWQAALPRMTWNGQLEMQYSLDNLFSSQRKSLGSRDTVRGFLDESLVVNHAVLLRNEITMNPISVISYTKHWVQSCAPSFFIDFGKAYGPGLDSAEKKMLVGTGIGLGTSLSQNFQLQCSYSVPLLYPDFIRSPSPVFYFSLSKVF